MTPETSTHFDYTKLHEFFNEIKLHSIENKRVSYLLRNEDGHMVDEILFFTPWDMRLLVDNYPGQKQYFQSNLPILTMEQFQSDVERTGLKLTRKITSPQNAEADDIADIHFTSKLPSAGDAW